MMGLQAYIDDAGTGALNIQEQTQALAYRSIQAKLRILLLTVDLLRFSHDNVTKFETTSTGIDVTGGVVY